VWAFDHSLSGADAFARSGVSGRAAGRNRFVAPATFQDLKGRNKAIAPCKDCASLLHVLTRAFTCFNDHPQELRACFERRVKIDRANVIVLNDNVSTWSGPAVHLAQRCNGIANEQQRKPREGQVEQCAADLINGLDICFDEMISTWTCRPEPLECPST
jgi:hypothetical protein